MWSLSVKKWMDQDSIRCAKWFMEEINSEIGGVDNVVPWGRRKSTIIYVYFSNVYPNYVYA